MAEEINALLSGATPAQLMVILRFIRRFLRKKK